MAPLVLFENGAMNAKRGLAPLPLELRARRKAGARWALVQESLHLRGGLMNQRTSGFLLSDAIFDLEIILNMIGRLTVLCLLNRNNLSASMMNLFKK